MKKVKFLIVIISFLFILISCKDNDKKTLSNLYSEKDYIATLAQANSMIETNLSKDALYHKALCEYHLALYSDSVETAKLYTLLYDKDNDNQMRRIRQIILFYGETIDIVKSGERINKDYRITYNESLAYFPSLMELGYYEKANEFFASIKNNLSNEEELKILVSGKANSQLIISTLTLWYNESGISEIFKTEFYKVINLLLERGEATSILQFALSIFDESPYFALLMGDIYKEAKQNTRARTYWAMAQVAYPDEVRVRLFSLL